MRLKVTPIRSSSTQRTTAGWGSIPAIVTTTSLPGASRVSQRIFNPPWLTSHTRMR